MNKRGMFFTLDAVIGITILFVGVFIAYFAFVQEPVIQPSLGYAEDIMAILSKTRFNNINLTYTTPEVRVLIENGVIDVDKTVLAQIGEFYYLKEKAKAVNDLITQQSMRQYTNYTIFAVTRGALPKVYGWEVRIKDGNNPSERIYPPIDDPRLQGPPKSNAKIKIVTHNLAFGTYHQREAYGPYLVEVEVWG